MFKDLFSLNGRVALVTGGSRGIGKMIAAGFLAQGAAKVYITARKAGPCEATAKELTAAYDGECIALPIDISTMTGIDMLAAEIKKQRGVDSTLIRGSGGEFEITVDGKLVFSKKSEGRFPDPEEVLAESEVPAVDVPEGALEA